jgi:hypothetical protein
MADYSLPSIEQNFITPYVVSTPTAYSLPSIEQNFITPYVVSTPTAYSLPSNEILNLIESTEYESLPLSISVIGGDQMGMFYSEPISYTAILTEHESDITFSATSNLLYAYGRDGTEQYVSNGNPARYIQLKEI